MRSLIKLVPVLLGAAVISGCGKSWNGQYQPAGFPPGKQILEIKDDTAVRSLYQYGRLFGTNQYKVEQKSDRIILTGYNNSVYVYAQAEDGKGLKCISQSCKGWLADIHDEWVRTDKQ
ncbi:hypothetical protein [Pseudomonas sp. RIT-To-2]|uniref:hypothetical protein n=1 Tax=Pseudomonas sp. RIT-To-2 TaxID=3462541 RepID=UPI002412F04E